MSQQKRVLVLNASCSEEGLIRALKKLGCYVITTGNRPDHPGHKLADEYVYGNYVDKELIYDLAQQLKVDAVCPATGDLSVMTAAYVSERLGFTGQDSYAISQILHNKDQFAEFADKTDGIYSPATVYFSDLRQAEEWAEREEHRYPLIVKPVDLDGGVGIQRVDSLEELLGSIRYAFEKSFDKRILVQEFLEGTLHALCTFLVDQKVAAACPDSNYSYINPYRVEVVVFPSNCEQAMQQDLIRQIELIADKLHLTDGIFHVQYIVRDGKPYIIECMRRVLGNMYSISANHFGDGFDWDYWEARAKCGFGCSGFPEHVPQKGVWAHRVLLADRNGVLKGFEIPPSMEKYIYHKRFMRSPGYEITNHMSDVMGILFMEFSSQEEMMEIAVERFSEVKVLLE